MRKLILIAALSCLGSSALAQSAKPRIVHLNPAKPDWGDPILIPAASTMRVVKLTYDGIHSAVFRGRFTLSGNYLIEGFGEDTFVTFWPDKKTLAVLPYWQYFGGPKELYISNGSAFAEAVVPKDKLRMLKAETLAAICGRVTIIADDYGTSIECDSADFSARFVSVVKPAVTLAAKFESQNEC